MATHWAAERPRETETRRADVRFSTYAAPKPALVRSTPSPQTARKRRSNYLYPIASKRIPTVMLPMGRSIRLGVGLWLALGLCLPSGSEAAKADGAVKPFPAATARSLVRVINLHAESPSTQARYGYGPPPPADAELKRALPGIDASVGAGNGAPGYSLTHGALDHTRIAIVDAQGRVRDECATGHGDDVSSHLRVVSSTEGSVVPKAADGESRNEFGPCPSVLPCRCINAIGCRGRRVHHPQF